MNPNPNQLTPVIKAKLKIFSDAIVNRPPLCSGTWGIPTDSAELFFKKGEDSAGWLNLLKATETQVESLAKACAPATFGADGKDVMDLSYRKAGKMDVVDFVTRFNPDNSGLTEFVRSHLLEGNEDLKSLRTELYKLNVYGKGSFFKSHKDTPRGVNMIGSLVVIFPTVHKGGALILRHNDQEYIFDSGIELSRTQNPSVAFVAFYSDVEHEVTVVESGYRVSLTYNLYVTATAQQHNLLSAPSSCVMPNEFELNHALSDLLAEETFLPQGGTIGFGLLHQYPVSKTEGSLESVLDCLKGSDSAILRVCTSLGLKLKPKVIYQEDALILMDEFIDLGYVDDPLEDLLCTDDGRYGYEGFIVKSRGLEENGGGKFEYEPGYGNGEDYRSQEVWWLTKRTKLTRERTDYTANFGNEPDLAHTYGDVVLIAKVGGHGNRQQPGYVNV